jgi:hypothetical protein
MKTTYLRQPLTKRFKQKSVRGMKHNARIPQQQKRHRTRNAYASPLLHETGKTKLRVFGRCWSQSTRIYNVLSPHVYTAIYLNSTSVYLNNSDQTNLYP